MTFYKCDKCDRCFNESDYEQHINRQTPCISLKKELEEQNEKIKELEKILLRQRDLIIDQSILIRQLESGLFNLSIKK